MTADEPNRHGIHLYTIEPAERRWRRVARRLETSREAAPEASRTVIVDRVASVDPLRRALRGRDLDEIPPIKPLAAVTTDRLRAHSFAVPQGAIGAGRPLESHRDPRSMADDWVAHLYADEPAGAAHLETVSKPVAFVEALERLLNAAIIPTTDGWIADGASVVAGDRERVTHRTEELSTAGPSLDHEVVEEALELDRTDMTESLHETLESYLCWCRNHEAVSEIQRRVYATLGTDHAHTDHLVYVSQGAPAPLTALLMERLADVSVSVVTGLQPGNGPPPAWGRPIDTVATRWRRWRTDASVEYHPDPRGPAAYHALAAGRRPRRPPQQPALVGAMPSDPLDATLDLLTGLAEVEESSPSELLVITGHPRTASRLMRRATSALPLARVGAVPIARTPVSVLGLAWLRILEGRREDRGWAVVLERAGCSAGDLEAWLEADEKPTELVTLRARLRDLDGRGVLRAVTAEYDLDRRITNTLLDRLGDTGRSRGETLSWLTDEHDRNPTARVNSPTDDAIRVCPAESRPSDPVETVIHLDEEPMDASGPLVVRPPLGVRWRRRAVDIAGQALEVQAWPWATLRALTDGTTVRRRRRIAGSLAIATERVVLLGSSAAVTPTTTPASVGLDEFVHTPKSNR